MKFAAKFGIAVLAAILLSNPLCICVGSTIKVADAAAPPCHPAQPASNPDDSTKPSCIFIDSLTLPVEMTELDHAVVPCDLPLTVGSIEIHPTIVSAPTFKVAMFAPPDRVVTLHQFLI